jgi:Glyoxalase-like domain
MKLIGVQMGSMDPKRLAEFYIKVFGKAKWEMPGDWYGWDIGGSNLMFGPHSEVGESAKDPKRIMISVEDEDVPKAFAKFIEAGATEIAKPYNPDEASKDFYLATVADPDI